MEAYKDETKAEVVYSNVVRLSFTGAGSQSTVLADVIPVGAYVEVTEVYSGASYSLVGEATATAVIQAAETAQVSFTNEYNSSGNQGGAATNHFVFEKERDENGEIKNDSQPQWKWDSDVKGVSDNEN